MGEIDLMFNKLHWKDGGMLKWFPFGRTKCSLECLGGTDVGDALGVDIAVDASEDTEGFGLGDAVGLLLGGGAIIEVSEVADEAQVEELLGGVLDDVR